MQGSGTPPTDPAAPGWIALSDRDLLGAPTPAPIGRGLFVLEFRLPLDVPTVLLSLQKEAQNTVSVFYDPVAGPSLLFRSGPVMRRHRIDADLPRDLSGVARLSFWADSVARSWRMRFQPPDNLPATEARGADPLPFDGGLMRQLSDRMGGGMRHPAVLWFGLSSGASLPPAAPWIGLNTPVETSRGILPAALLGPGMQIRTLDHGMMPLRAVHRMSLPAAGSFAPVVLRQPFFGEQRDLLVSADQLVLIAGPSVEYLTGAEEVLVPAGALADGRVAERDSRRAVTDCLALDFGAPALVVADGCSLLAAPAGTPPKALPRRALKDWELLPLLSLLGRTSLRRAV